MLTYKKYFALIVVASVILGILSSFVILSLNASPRLVIKRSINKVFSFNIFGEKKAITDVMDNYLDAWENAKPREMYSYISSQERENISVADYSEQFLEFPVRPYDHTFKSLHHNDQEAKAIYKIDWPDYASGKSLSREESFYLIKEGGRWKLREEISLAK